MKVVEVMQQMHPNTSMIQKTHEIPYVFAEIPPA